MRLFTSVSLRRMTLGICVAALFIVMAPVNAHHGGSHYLDIYTLTCWSYNDPSGSDEPYLKIEDNRVWTGPDCDPVQAMYPNIHTDFWNQTDVYIMEDDWGPDDSIGHVSMFSQNGLGTQTYYSHKWVNGVGLVVNYSMDYAVYQ